MFHFKFDEKMKKRLYIGLIVLLAAVACFSGIQLAVKLYDYAKGEKAYNDLTSYAALPESSAAPASSSASSAPADDTADPADTPEASPWPVVNFGALTEINEDFVGWIRIPDTTVNYPIVQGRDNKYYLRRLFTKEWNNSGCLFLDYRVNRDFSSRHSVIYGHHMQNDTMFSCLTNYSDQAYYDAHPTIYLVTPTENLEISVFSGYVSVTDLDPWQLTFSSDDEFQRWLDTTVSRSRFESSFTPTVEDRIITLSTCSYEYSDARFILIGAARPVEEDPEELESSAAAGSESSDSEPASSGAADEDGEAPAGSEDSSAQDESENGQPTDDPGEVQHSLG